MDQVSDSVVLEHVDDVALFGQPLQSQLKLIVLVHAAFAELTALTATFEATANVSETVMQQIGQPVGCELLATFHMLLQ